MYQARLERERELNQQQAAQTEKESQKQEKQQHEGNERAAGVKRKRVWSKAVWNEEAAVKLEYKAGQIIISEAKQKLADAIKDKSYKQMSIAQVMLEQGEKK